MSWVVPKSDDFTKSTDTVSGTTFDLIKDPSICYTNTSKFTTAELKLIEK